MPTSPASKAVTSTPYANGVELRIRQHVPPTPFDGEYGPSPRPEVQPEGCEVGLVRDRLAFALDNPPLETLPPSGDEHTFTITGTKTLRRFEVDSGGAHVVTGYADGNPTLIYLAKIYDGVYYPLEGRGSGRDCMTLADCDYAVEAWAYATMQPVATVGCKLVPEYFGAWTFSLDTHGHHGGRRRWVRMLLLELVGGETMLAKILRATKNDAIQYPLSPPEEFRLRVLKDIFEAEITIWWDAEILHNDQAPRNIMVQNDGSVVIIDFNQAVVYPFIDYWPGHPKYRKGAPSLPPSPIERYWPFAPGGSNLADTPEFGNPWASWIPQSWLKNQELAAEWLLETWISSSPDRYRPLSDYFLNHPAHMKRSRRMLAALQKLGRKRDEKENFISSDLARAA